MENNQNLNYTHQSSDNGNSNVVNINTGRTVSNYTSGDGPKKPSGKGKGRGVGKSILFGTVSAAAVAGVVAGAMYISGPNEYTLTYIVDGKVVEVNVEEDALLSSIPAPSVTGYSFDGWYVDPTYTTMLTPGYKFNGDIELYPKFTPNKYTITYYSNNGVGGIFTQEVYFNSEYTTIANTFAKPNYTFIGWSTDINARYDSSNIIPSAQVTLLDTEGITLYAVWKGDDRSISFDTTNMMLNGTAYTIQDVTIPYGDTYTLPTILGTISHSVNASDKFAGYNINGNIYQPGSTIVITDNINISINWQSASSVLNFNVQSPNGESVSNISPVICYDEDTSYSYTNLPAPDSATNYEFVGWNTKSDGTGDTYLVGETFTTTEATSVLYAIWQGKQRTLNIYNAGTVVEVITCRYGDSITLPTYTLDKHTFLGFNDVSNYTGTTYSGTINILFSDLSVNLYAEYSRNQITVSFNPNGGVGSIDNITINSEELYTFDSNEIAAQRESITRRYYTLAGWSTDQNADPATVSFDILAGSTNLPLYAIWSRNQVQVTYAPNMDSVVPVAHKIDQGTDYTFTETGFQKAGYYIVEFKVNGTSYKVGDTLQSVEVDNLQIEVVWKKIEKVLFKNAGNISTVDTVSGDTVSVGDLTVGTKIIAPYVSLENSYYDDTNGDRHYFAGWATTENATEPTVFAKSTELTVTDTQQIYYAVYMEASTCLNYTYNATNNNYTVSLNESVFDISVEDNYTLIVPNIYNGKPVVKFENSSAFIDEIGGGVWPHIKNAVVSQGITEIGNYAFCFNYDLEDVTLPNGLTHIGFAAFNECSSLTSITIPESVTSIGGQAFYFCEALTSIIIPTGVTSIEISTFSDCVALKSVTIPESVTSIGEYAFSSCSSLTSITIPENVTSIGDSAFYYAGLTSIVIPESVTNIGEYVFGCCDKLTTVTINTNTVMTYSDQFVDSPITTVTYGEGVTSIPDNAWKNCTTITTINLPSTLTSVGAYAFSYTNITSIELPNSALSLGEGVFYCCAELTSAELPQNLTTIPNNLFNSCTFLTDVSIPSTVTSIGSGAFSSCNELFSIVIPEGVTVLNDYTFDGCFSLTNVTLPNELTSIGMLAFGACNIPTLTLPNTLKTIGISAFNSSCLTSIVIPEGVTTIGAEAFGYATSLQSVVIPSTVTSVGENAFIYCFSIETVVINTNATITYGRHFSECTDIATVTYGSGVTSIPNGAWNQCSTLKTVNLPNGLLTIGSVSFIGTGLTSITIPNTVTTIGGEAFYGTKLTAIEIPSSVQTISAGAFWNCKELKAVTLFEGLKNIEDQAFVFSGITSITIPSTVISVGTEAFANCSSLTEVTINTFIENTYRNCFINSPITTVIYGESIDVIPESAWEGCATLTTVNFPEGLLSIRNNAFAYSGITGVVFPSTVEEVLDEAFKECLELETVVLNEGLTFIGEGVFGADWKLTSITIPSTVNYLGNDVFDHCAELENVTIHTNEPIYFSSHFGASPIKILTYGEGVTSIPQNAWENCVTITTLNLPDSLKHIGHNAFYGCREIINGNTVLKEGLETIGVSAFEGCAKITNLYLPSTLGSIGDRAFYGMGSDSDLTVTINTQVVLTYEGYFKTNIYSIVFGENVTWIPDLAWENCKILHSVTLPSSLETFSNAFKGCTGLEVLVLNTTLPISKSAHFPDSPIKHVTYGDLVTSIPVNAWENCETLTTVNLSNSIKTIGAFAFAYSGLQSINLPEGLEEIGTQAFVHSSLQSVVLPTTLTTIGNYAFASCEKLKEVTINTVMDIRYEDYFMDCPIKTITYGPSVTSITDYAWYCCGSITEINLPDGLLEINANAFAGISRIDIHIPDSVTTIGDGAFEGHRVNLPESLEYIGAYAFAAAKITNDIPSNVTQIGEYAFWGASGITEINIEYFVEMGNAAFSEMPDLEIVFLHNNGLSDNLFYGCPLLKTVYLGDGVSGIGSYAFYNCTRLETIYLKNVRIIGEYAFEGCTNVKTMYFFEKNPSNFQFTVDDLPFENIEKIYVPFGHYTKYQNVFGSQYSDKMDTHEL